MGRMDDQTGNTSSYALHSTDHAGVGHRLMMIVGAENCLMYSVEMMNQITHKTQASLILSTSYRIPTRRQ